MAPSYTATATTDASLPRPTKRLRLDAVEVVPRSDAAADETAVIPPHPLGIKPAGNALTAKFNLKAKAGSFSMLPDELLARFLECLDAAALVRLGGTCKVLYAFTRFDELWRALFTESKKTDFQWRGSWRSTYLSMPESREAHIDCSGLFSDVLYRPFQCTYTSLKPFTSRIPLENAIPRMTDLTHEEFSTKWTSKPFILTGPVKEWPVFGKWTTQYLLENYANVPFRAEAVDWPLETYVNYMNSSTDESPLYLFDRSFAEKMKITVGKNKEGAAYWAPACFGEDLFAVLGNQRPDCRWMIMGPARSGSTFHKDPNATSAWNAVLTGSKYWLMFPSSANLPPPPGVLLSEDSSEITAPLSIAEYLLSFHAIARATPGCREGICSAGEVLYVPSGWFHLVLNLEESIALTQNFVPRAKLADVLGFLRDQAEQASGFKDDVTDPYGLFVQKLGEREPALLEQGMQELEKKGKPRGRGKWQELVRGGAAVESENQGGFTFGFGGDEDDEIP
ncbi:F-box protein [Diplodia seriata]|uniref:F-box protein n=1 Tax=Diplodia seriata TaxID=420778 RepID=A0A1S8BIR0_9PEZI|nr:F-box protein [Diplodia seriata]